MKTKTTSRTSVTEYPLWVYMVNIHPQRVNPLGDVPPPFYFVLEITAGVTDYAIYY